MKIALVAQDLQYPGTIQRFLAEADKSYPLITMIGGVQQVAAVAEQEQPDLLMLEGQTFSSMELEVLNPLNCSSRPCAPVSAKCCRRR